MKLQLLNAVRANRFAHTWSEVRSTNNDHVGVFRVSSAPIRVDGQYLRCTASELQLIADELDALLCTPMVIDLRYAQASTKLLPRSGNPVYRSDADHTDDVERQIDKVGGHHCGIVADIGKHWVLHRLSSASHPVLYGWHTSAKGKTSWGMAYDAETDGLFVIQRVSNYHLMAYSDYAMTAVLMHNRCCVDGVDMDTEEVLTDPDLCGLLVANAKPLPFTRIPGALEGDTDPAPPPPDYDDPDDWRPLMRKGDRGEDVVAWQEQLSRDGYRKQLGRNPIDGAFGPKTHNVTVSWQGERGLPKNGVVDADVRDAIGTDPIDRGAVEVGEVKFIKAKRYRWYADGARDIRWLVIHTAEIPESSTAAENLGAWTSRGAPGKNGVERGVSWHWSGDDDSIVASVEEKDGAHAAGNHGNLYGLHIELGGYARQSPDEWDDPYSRRMLERVALLFADVCVRRNWPVRFLTGTQLRAGEVGGITTHKQISKAWPEDTNHGDPGIHFPMTWFLSMVQAAVDAA